jgi:hypothetical protein
MEQLDYNLLYRWFVGLGWMSPSGCPLSFEASQSGDARHRRALAPELASASEAFHCSCAEMPSTTSGRTWLEPSRNLSRLQRLRD